MNYAFVIITHFLATLKLLNLKSFFFFILTSTFVFNKTFQSFILASSLLVIVLRIFHCEINILVFVIVLSINVPPSINHEVGIIWINHATSSLSFLKVPLWTYSRGNNSHSLYYVMNGSPSKTLNIHSTKKKSSRCKY